MTEVRRLAAYMLSHIEKMPDIALLTEEELEIREVKSFPVSQYITDMYGKITAGYTDGRFVLYRKTDKNDNAFALAKLMRILKIKSVTVIVRAEKLCEADVPFMRIKDFIRLYEMGNTAPVAGKNGGVYAISKGKCTEAEKRAIRILGADAVGENILPLALASENVNFDGFMLFKECITGGEYESQV